MKFICVEAFDKKMSLLRVLYENRFLDFQIFSGVFIIKFPPVYIYIEEDQLSKGCQANEIPAFGRGS